MDLKSKVLHRFGVSEHFLYHHVGFGYTLWLYMKFDIFILNIYKLYMDMYTCIYIVDGYEKKPTISQLFNSILARQEFHQNQSIQIIKVK
jgi:hypothetical protein